MPAPNYEPRTIGVVGSSNMDLIVHGGQIPRPGQTVIGGQFAMAGGGKGANQAIAAARLGGRVSFVSRVGDDLFGSQLLENYLAEEVSSTHVLRTAGTPTGVALIVVDHQGENIISVAPGANAKLTPADARQAIAAIDDLAVLLLQLESPMKTVEAAARAARDRGAKVVLDPAPAAELSNELLKCVDVLTPNETEASLLTGIGLDTPDFAELAAGRLLKMGAASVAVTLGARGCCVATSEGHTLLPALKVDPVDTTAAGDAFNGALAVALASGLPLHEAVQRHAMPAGALATTKIGAQPSLPSRKELTRFRP